MIQTDNSDNLTLGMTTTPMIVNPPVEEGVKKAEPEVGKIKTMTMMLILMHMENDNDVTVHNKPKFKGRCTALKGFVFYCSNKRQAGVFSMTIEEAIDHSG